MAEEIVMADVMNLLEVEPAAALPAPGPDIPALRENLAILVSSGRCKESIGVNLNTRTSEAAGRQRCHEVQQKARGLRWRQDN